MRNRLTLGIGAVAYIAALSWAYVNLVSPQFAYLGYGYVYPSWLSLVFAAAIALTPIVWLPVSLGRPSQLVYWLLYVIVYVPSLMIPAFAVDPDLVTVFWHGAILLAGFGIVGALITIPTVRVVRPRIPQSVFWLGVIVASIATDLFIVSQFGLHLHSLSVSDILDVYGLRADYNVTLAQTDSPVAYAIGWQSNVLNPLLIIRGLVGRKPLPLLLGFIGQLGIFEISGLKAVLFSIGLIAVVFLVTSLRRRQFGATVLWGTTLLIVASIAADALFRSITFSSLFIRRLLVTPGLLTGDYLQFFSHNPKMLLSHSFLAAFIQNPYGSLSPPFLIGATYFHSASDSANANIWADAFANFGAAGVIAFSILLGVILWTFDSLTKNAEWPVAALMLAVPAFTLSNSALFTTLLNHGLLVALIVALGLPQIQTECASTAMPGSLNLPRRQGQIADTLPAT